MEFVESERTRINACVTLRIVNFFTVKFDFVVNIRVEHNEEILTAVFPAHCRFAAYHVTLIILSRRIFLIRNFRIGSLSIGNFGIRSLRVRCLLS